MQKRDGGEGLCLAENDVGRLHTTHYSLERIMWSEYCPIAHGRPCMASKVTALLADHSEKIGAKNFLTYHVGQ
jgi:hypothetical protein